MSVVLRGAPIDYTLYFGRPLRFGPLRRLDDAIQRGASEATAVRFIGVTGAAWLTCVFVRRQKSRPVLHWDDTYAGGVSKSFTWKVSK